VNFIIEEGHLGKRMVLTGRWEPSYARDAAHIGVVELELNYARGWSACDLAFLSELSFLRALELTDWNLDDVSGVHALQSLVRLKISTYCKTSIDFAAFPALEDLSLEWRPGARSLFGCSSLRRVFLNKYAEDDLVPLLALPRLSHLSVASPKIDRLGASKSSSLEFLGVYAAKRLVTLDGVEQLPNLTALEVNDCPRVSDLRPLRSLRRLASIHLCNDGNILSLEPLAGHEQLEELLFYGNTRIEDGRISVLKPLGALRVAFQDRRHYDMKRAEFPAG
jgi:Leucine-rich repeat (LRR) protein